MLMSNCLYVCLWKIFFCCLYLMYIDGVRHTTQFLFRVFHLSPPFFSSFRSCPPSPFICFVHPFLFLHFVCPPPLYVGFDNSFMFVRSAFIAFMIFHSFYSPPHVWVFHFFPLNYYFIINQISLSLLEAKSLHGGGRWRWCACAYLP